MGFGMNGSDATRKINKERAASKRRKQDFKDAYSNLEAQPAKFKEVSPEELAALQAEYALEEQAAKKKRMIWLAGAFLLVVVIMFIVFKLLTDWMVGIDLTD